MQLKFEDIEISSINPENTIFENFKLSGYTIPHSCLKGRCSECKLKVISGEYYMPENQEGLTNNEVNQGYCLSCITKPKSDLTLSEVNIFNGILPEVQIRPVKISKLEFLSDEIVKVTLRMPPNNSINFIPGQYIDLRFNEITRSYSIASSARLNTIELLIKNYYKGKFSNYLFNEAKVDDLLRMEGPKGTYVFTKKSADYLLFLSTGTGIAPHISIIQNIIEKNIINPENIFIIHGQKQVKDHIYNLELLFPKIKIIKTISRENKLGFFHGYVQEAAIDLNIDLSKTQVFACGNPNMIFDSKQALLNNGLIESNFNSEIFIPSN